MLGLILLLGFALNLGGSIIIVVQAFKQHVAWGLCALLVPFAALVFVIKFWKKLWVRRGFYLSVAGTVLLIVVAILMPSSSY